MLNINRYTILGISQAEIQHSLCMAYSMVDSYRTYSTLRGTNMKGTGDICVEYSSHVNT